MLSVIGAGEIGRVLLRCAGARGEGAQVVRRGDDLLQALAPSGPIWVCVREDDLPPLIASLAPLARRAVFVQNGLIEALLAPLAPTTQGLLWFTAKGDFFQVLQPSVFFGPEAPAAVALLAAGGIAAQAEDDPRRFREEVAYKLAWNNVVGLPLAVHGVPLARYLTAHRAEAEAIVRETCAVLGAAWRQSIDAEEALRRLFATTGALGWVTGGKKALAYRNGAIVRLAGELGLAAPVQASLLAAP